MIKDKILSLLETYGFEYKYLEHEETPTSQDSARVRGSRLEEGAKAIILKEKRSGENIMVVISGHLKINIKSVESKVRDYRKAFDKDFHQKIELTFETPSVILERYGVMIGGIPPFGELMGVTTFYDRNIFNNEKMDFNCGERTCSIEMKTIDYKKIIDNSKIGEYSK